jgi:hypothetical protein
MFGKNNAMLKRVAGWLVLGALTLWVVTGVAPMVADFAQYAATAAVVLWAHTKLVPNSEVAFVWRKFRSRRNGV